MDRQEAVGVVVGIEQGELLPAVNRIASVVDVQRNRGRALPELARRLSGWRKLGGSVSRPKRTFSAEVCLRLIENM